MTNGEWMVSNCLRFSDLNWLYSFSRTHIQYHRKELGVVEGYGASAILRWLDEEHKEEGEKE